MNGQKYAMQLAKIYQDEDGGWTDRKIAAWRKERYTVSKLSEQAVENLKRSDFLQSVSSYQSEKILKLCKERNSVDMSSPETATSSIKNLGYEKITMNDLHNLGIDYIHEDFLVLFNLSLRANLDGFSMEDMERMY